MDVGHGVVEIEGFVLISRDKIHDFLMHQIGHVLLVLELHLLPIEGVLLPLGLGVPIDPAPLEGQVLIETKIRWHQGELPPLAERGGRIARLLENFRHHRLLLGSEPARLVLIHRSGAERISSCQDQRPRGTTKRSSVGVGELHPPGRQGIQIRRLVLVRSKTVQTIKAQIIREDKDDVGFARGDRLGGRRLLRPTQTT